MKAYERRAAGIVEVFNLDKWDAAKCCWTKTSRKIFESETAARAAAATPGRYRLSKMIDGQGRVELEPFEIG